MAKRTASLLSIVYFATNVLWAHTPELQFWKERSVPRAAVSRQPMLSNGNIRKIFSPAAGKSGPVVVHIQDVHGNAEAQTNISKEVQDLIQSNNAELVALEGAFGPMDFSWYRAHPHQDSVKTVADYLFREKRISGPVYTAFTSQAPIPQFIGVDDKIHYDANVAAYRDASRSASAHKKMHEQRVRDIAAEKITTFHPRLKDFDDRIQAYQKGTLSWGDYVRLLSQHTDSFSPKIEAFLAALEMEEKLNYSQVERERAKLITQLVQSVDKSEADALVAASAAYKMGKLSHSDFYTHLRQRCAKNGVALRLFPAMDEYIRYVLLSDSLDVDGILTETAALEKEIYTALAQTDTERRLIEESRRTYLTGKLLDFALTKEEWGEYRELAWENGANADLLSFERFYVEAELRDAAMAKNLLRAMTATGAKKIVLVTGGFHSAGIARALQPKGVTIVTYVPKITKIEDETGTAYLNTFTQEKTPLDKLFAGEKLFLAGAPMTPPAATGGLVDLTSNLQHPNQPVPVPPHITDQDLATKKVDGDTASMEVEGQRLVVNENGGSIKVTSFPTLKSVLALAVAGRLLYLNSGVSKRKTLSAEPTTGLGLFVPFGLVLWVVLSGPVLSGLPNFTLPSIPLSWGIFLFTFLALFLSAWALVSMIDSRLKKSRQFPAKPASHDSPLVLEEEDISAPAEQEDTATGRFEIRVMEGVVEDLTIFFAGKNSSYPKEELNKITEQLKKALAKVRSHLQQMTVEEVSRLFPEGSQTIDVTIVRNHDEGIYMSRPGDGQLVIDEKALSDLGDLFLPLTINHELYPTEFDALRADHAFFKQLWSGREDPAEKLASNGRVVSNLPYIEFLKADHFNLDLATAGIMVRNFAIKIARQLSRGQARLANSMMEELGNVLVHNIPVKNTIYWDDATAFHRVAQLIRQGNSVDARTELLQLGQRLQEEITDEVLFMSLSEGALVHLNRLGSSKVFNGHDSPLFFHTTEDLLVELEQESQALSVNIERIRQKLKVLGPQTKTRKQADRFMQVLRSLDERFSAGPDEFPVEMGVVDVDYRQPPSMSRAVPRYRTLPPQISVNQLAAAIRAEVIQNISIRQGNLSFDLAHSVRPIFANAAPELEKNFAIGLGLALEMRFGKKIGSLEEAFETNTETGFIVNVNEEGDILKVKEALSVGKPVGVVLTRNADAALAAQVSNLVRGAHAPLAVVSESELGTESEEIPYDRLFEAFAARFESPEGQRFFTALAVGEMDGKRVIVVGVSPTPYQASEELLKIMRILAPIQGGCLLIDLGAVLKAAVMA